jgi:hypothetical protein
VSGGDRPPQIEGEKMKSLLTSSLLTVFAVPFLMAAPAHSAKATAAKQDSTQSTTSSTTKTHKKHGKKSTTSSTTTSTPPQSK